MTAVIPDTLAMKAWKALDTVIDPELDQPVTELGFVAALSVRPLETGGHEVCILLRLPTYFCAPNFAYLMVADAHDAVLSLPGIETARVELADHFASEEINAGVAAEESFGAAFPGQGAGANRDDRGDLEELRLTFRRKAHLACLERTCRQLIRAGWQVDALADTVLGDVPDSPERKSLLRRRADLGISNDPAAPLFVESTGERVPVGELPARLRFAKAVRISIEGNSGLCRGLLDTRLRRMAEEAQG
jgi:metal-sulfur cluster biosynthetic enzyme